MATRKVNRAPRAAKKPIAPLDTTPIMLGADAMPLVDLLIAVRARNEARRAASTTSRREMEP